MKSHKNLWIGGGLTAVLLAILIAPAIATTKAWTWSEQIGLPRGVALLSIAERQGQWLLNGEDYLARFDGTNLTDLTREARERGMPSIRRIASDGRQWMIIGNPSADRRDVAAWLYDGQTWTDLTGKFPGAESDLVASGHDGVWYAQAYHAAQPGQPSSWTMFELNGTASAPSIVNFPLSISANAAGCVNDASGTALCTGASSAFRVNGAWYFAGGMSENRGSNGTVTQTASASVWRLNGIELSPIQNLPRFKFVSAVWSGTDSALIATSDNANPMRADHLWLFDGHTLADLTNQAAPQNLLPSTAANPESDVRSMHAAWNGMSWVIVNGLKISRLTGTKLVDEGYTRDVFTTLSANPQGLFVLGGHVGSVGRSASAGHAPADFPILVTVEENPVADEPVAPPATVVIASKPVRETVKNLPLSAALPFQRDSWSGTQWKAWLDPKIASFGTKPSATYAVAAQNDKGIAKIDMWVDGVVARSCDAGKTSAVATCAVTLYAGDVARGSEVFVNAVVTDMKDRYVWTDGARIKREASEISVSALTAPVVAIEPVVAGPVFIATSNVSPAVSEIARGSQLTFATRAQNNTSGLERVELYLNGKLARICQYGASMSAMTCNLAVDTSNYAEGTILSYMGRAIDGYGRDLWSNAKSVTVRGSTTPSLAYNSATMNAWAWLEPGISEIIGDQTATYKAGAWSKDGIAKIDIIVDGIARQTCAFIGTAARECAFTLRTSDFDHGHMAAVNARITDGAGRVIWTTPETVGMKRSWEPVNIPGAYATIQADRANFATGERATFTLRGWSPSGLDRLELFVNGANVLRCPSDACIWTSDALTGERVEFQARAIDALGRATWTGLYGIVKK